MNEIKRNLLDKPIGSLIGDYDYWLAPCEHCGHDEGASSPPKKGNHHCWKCGRRAQREYTERALKEEFKSQNVEIGNGSKS